MAWWYRCHGRPTALCPVCGQVLLVLLCNAQRAIQVARPHATPSAHAHDLARLAAANGISPAMAHPLGPWAVHPSPRHKAQQAAAPPGLEEGCQGGT